MRSATSLTLHAILAACLVAFAASSAAAGPAKAYLARNDGRVQQLEIQGWQWSGVSKVDSLTVRQGVKVDDSKQHGEWIADVERPAEATGENVQGAQDIVITGSRIPQPIAASRGLDAGMKRLEAQDKMGNAANTAPDRGTLRIKVKMPWLACEEGRRYPSLELADGSQRVVLKDAVITSCGKVSVRGWNPEKKGQ